MTAIIGGHGLGLQDGSLALLNRNDQTGQGTLDQRMQAYVNVSGGNLLIQERDVFLPSQGDDFTLVRTYNSRGAIGGAADGWSYSTAITLSTHQDKPADNSPSINAYVVTYGDGSVAHFDFDATRNLWVSTDGGGAYETLQVLAQLAPDGTKYRLTRADQSQYNFDKDFVFTSMVDTNGVRTQFTYQGGRLQTVSDDKGHLITYQYDGIGKLASIVDELGIRLVSYTYSQGLLSTVTDRFGHVTTYSYNSNGLLTKIGLPFKQTVNGQVQTFEAREIQFSYQSINWDDHPHFVTPFDSGSQWALTSITDALGGVTTFENNFIFNTTAVQPGDRDLAYKQVGGRYFAGGTTRVVDAMGNGLATSNAAEFQQKRVALGFAADVTVLTQAQKDALRQQFSLSYTFDPDGYITQVVDQQGFKTTYTYGGKTAGDPQTAVNEDNLLSVTDRNGWGATASDSAYFRDLRKDLGYVDLAGNGKLAASLTAAEKTTLLAKFTTTFTYDARGNLLTRTDGLGNQNSYTYTAFNKVASATSATGNALATLDDLTPGDSFYRNKRVQLGFPNVAASSLTAAQKTAIKNLYTYTYTYDATQNLITRLDPGGDRTDFQYDLFGNQIRRTVVYRDSADVAVPAKNQVTSYAYDQFGNNVSIVDGEGKTTTKTYDHFGNLLTSVDGRGGVTTFTYDADDRLLTATDPEGHTSVNAYDAVGNRISMTDANGHTISQIFDRNNLLIATIDPAVSAALTRNTTFKYDILGDRTEVTDAEGRKTTYTFDARRQLVDVATPQVLNGSEALVSYHTTYAYDGESNLVRGTDNNGNVTQTLYTANGLLKRRTDPIGNITEILYDANLAQVQITVGAQLAPALRRVLKFGRDEENQTTSETDALGNIMRYGLDAPGNVVSVTDANGNQTNFEYDKNNRLVKEIRPEVTDPTTGLPTRYTVLHQYDANGNEVSTTDENGHVTVYAFDKDDRRVMMTDGNGIKTVFTWDSRDNQTQIAIGVDAHLDTNGRVVIDSTAQAAVTSFTYDEFNELLAVTDAVGNALVSSDLPLYQNLRTELGFAPLVAGLSATDKTTLLNRFTERNEYDRVGNRTKLTDHLGRISTMRYDALDRLQTRSQAVGTTEERTSALRYDGNGNLVKQTDALGRTTRLTYDGNDRLIDETDPLGIVTRHQYDQVGNVTADTEAFGTAQARTTSYIYDLNDRLTRETDPAGHVKQYEYDAVGNRVKEIDARGGVTQLVYNALNRNIKIIDPLSFQSRLEYDGVGNNITIIDANGGIERLQYDGANRYIQTTDPVGRVTRFEYDRQNNAIKQTTAFGLPEAEVTSFVYDAEGNLRQTTDAAGKVSTQRFDDVYNLTSFTDNNGHTTTTAFDALNRQLRVTDPLSGVTTYTYDLEDNQLSETDALGHTRSFRYDARNQLVTQTDALGTQTTYGYDAVGNQVSITRAANTPQASTDTFVYNKDDKLISQTDALSNTTSYAYDANHNVISTTDALGRATTYTYDAANQVTSITDPLGQVTQYKYDGKGNRTQVTDARGNAQTAYYNRDDEVVLTVDGEGFAVGKAYDGNGNIIRVTEYMTRLGGVIDPAALPVPTSSTDDRLTTFQYDKLNRLIKKTDPQGGVSTLSYDAVGNKTAETDENGHTTASVYDALDRLISQTNPLGGVRSFTYDAVGNQLSETDENGHTRSFLHDLEDRLIRETDPLKGVTTYTYDAVGNQLTATDENGHTTRFVYDLDDRLISETNPLSGVKTYDYDAVGNQTGVHDENGHTTTSVYDANHRLIKQIDPLLGERRFTYDALGNQISATDENGHTTAYVYDKNNRLITETDPLNQVRSIVYDAVGNRLSATDENGHVSTFAYDRNNRLIKQIDALGRQRTFSYDATGNQLSMTDENGHTTSYVYDANDRLTKRTDPLGGERTYSYDAAGKQLSETDENGHTTTSVYDANDRLIKQIDPLLGKREFTYDAAGNQLSSTDENGHTTSFTYDVNDRLIKQIDPLLGERLFTYDAVGNQLSTTNENGHTTTSVYDADDRLIKQIDPLLGKRQFTYDAAGNQLTATDANGHTTTSVYDANDRLIKQIDPSSGAQLFTYDALGNQLSATDENGHTTSYAYDADNRLIRQTDALGKTQTFTYDAAGNRISVTDENSHTTSFVYDANDRLIKQIDPLLGKRLFSYDAVGNQLSATDENGHTTTSVYDANDRLTKQIDALLGERRFTYDALGNRLSATDENGHTTSFVYDVNDRVIKQTDPLGGEHLFTYDALGNRLSATDENGHTTSFVYDANERVIKQTDPLDGERLFTYDAVGNQLSATDENGHTTTSAYDANNRLIKQIDPLLGERRFTYDAVGNRLSGTDENGHTTSFSYDADNRLIQQTDALLGKRRFTYDAVGNQLSAIDENGHTTSLVYDANDRVVKQIDPLLGERVFSYDAVGNRLSTTDENGHATSFSYDANNRLTQQTDPLLGKRRFTYDAVGNRLSAIDEDGHTTSFVYDANDRLIKQTDPSGGARVFSYDAAGNQLSDTDENGHTTTSVYDANDRLIKQIDPLLGKREFTYDAVGNKLSTTDENGHTTTSVYDANDRLIKQTDPLLGKRQFTYDAVGNQVTTTDENGHTTTSVYDADDRLIKQIDPLLGKRQFTYDAAGNRISATDESGHTTSFSYDVNDRLVKQIDPLLGARLFTYDAVGNRLSATDENRHTTSYSYDANDRLTKQTDPLRGERLFTYDAVGNQLSATDENGHTTSSRYDANDRLITQTDALGKTQTYTYDAVGNQLSATDKNGHTTSFAYDAKDRLTKQVDALGQTQSHTYDAVGNRTSSIDENGHTTSFAYDALNRLLTQTDALGRAERFTYDAVGNQLSATDENGHATSFIYDADDRLITRTDALGKAQHHSYDAAGNLVSQTDENGHTTTYAYDADDRLIQQTDALGAVMSRAYDGAGNKVSETDQNGHTTTYAYDADNRKVSQTDALGKTTTCTYDAAGNRLTETDENRHTTAYAYDAVNRVTSMVDALGFSTSMRYDARGNTLETRQQLSLTDPSQQQVTRHAYDALDRLVSSLSAEGYLESYEYDGVGHVVKKTAFDDKFVPTAAGEAPLTGSGPSRITVTSYDADDRLVSQTSPLGFVTRYEYDAAGNRTAMVEAHGTAAARRTEMHYDLVNRVIETVDALGVVTHTVRDAAGNALEVHEAFGTPGARVMLYQYDADDRVSQQTDALGVVTQFAYDGVGNLIERRSAMGLPEARTEHFEYDANRRQTARINGEGERTEYAYDGVGNRTAVIVAPGLPEQRVNRFRYDGDNRLIGQTDGNGVETQYQYDGAGNKVKTIQLAAAYDSDGKPTGTYQGVSITGQQRETLFAYDLDNRLIQVTDPKGGVTKYVIDALGNRTQITDANGTRTVNTFDAAGRLRTNWVQGADHGGVLVTNSYDAFGNIVQTLRGFHDGSDTRQTTYTYDKRDRQTTITEYDKVDSLDAATVFSQAYSNTFEYDAFDNQTKVSQGVYLLTALDTGYDAAKAALAHPLIASFNYDRHDKLVGSTDGVGNILAYANDAYGNRVSQTTGFATPDARTVSFSYDRADRLISRRSGTGGVVKLSYDEAGNEVEKNTLQSGTESGSGATAPVWATQRFSYDGNGRVISETDGLGVSSQHVLDAFGNEIATRFAVGTADERTRRFEYDANNVLSAEIDALGNRTRYEVDKLGNRIAQTDALGYVTRLYYNELNQQIATLDPEGYLTTFSHDSAGNVAQVNVYLQRYTAPGNHRAPPTPSASDAPRVTRNEFDGAGNLIRKTEPDQRVKDFVYDSARKLRQITDHGSSLAAALALTADRTARVQTFDYDAAGRLTRFTHVDGVTEEYAYDSANNKTRETITNAHALVGGGSDPVRTTAYRYDADNRQTAQIFDSGALNQVTSLAYDKAGNVVAKTDARGNVTTMTYDLDNRMLSITDPLNSAIRFGYDRVGNRTSVTDGLGNETRFEYDLNNHATKVILPAVDVFTIRDGLQTNVHPTSETKYDAVGNVVQEIDPSGFKNSAFYDGNRNRIAEINGDNVLRTFSYDATGLVNRASLYMTRVDAAAHDSAAPPAPPSGEVRTIVSEHDAAGRLTRTIYPAIEKTSLSGVDTADPTATSAIVTPEERHGYNAFGERVQSTDRNGNISYAYFDERGRAVATVDSAGYLIESDYDDQGNVVQQRKYATPLNLSAVTAGTRPTAPSGDVFTVDRTFDAANRLIEEQSPPVSVDGAADPVRVITRYTYDAAGNQTSRTLAADSSEAATEYYYYDAANRQVAIVNDARVLHQIGYDANGNKSSVKRFLDPVSASVTLASATMSALLADVTPDATRDEETDFTYDALNRETRLTDLMGPGSADDITISSRYDAVGHLSLRTDPEGFVSQTAYDALGHITQTRSPDGNRSFVEYDAAGFKIKAWTGDLGSNQATVATNVTASIGNALSVGWEVAGNQLTSFLVYDTTAHDDPSAYANESGQQGSGAASVDVPLAGFSAGSVVYFRVVTVDAAGSRAWTDEYSVTVPVLLSSLTVAQAGSDLQLTARFNGAVTSPELLFGAGQTLANTAAFALQADGSYKALIANPAQGGQGLFYQLRWTANGSTYTTAATPFEAPGEHQAIDGTFTWPVPQPAQGDTQVVLLDGARQESAFQVNGQLQFTPAPLANGSHVYQVLYGQSVAESHAFTVTNRDHQTTGTPSAAVDVKDASGNVIGKSRTFTYQHNYSTHIEVALDAAEAARAAASLHVAYRAAGATGLGGFTDATVIRSGNTFSADAPLAPGVYDVKVSYIDAGQEVIVEWRRITVEATALHTPTVQVDNTPPFDFVGLPLSFTQDLSTTALTLTDVKSMTVVARESEGAITKLADGTVSVDPGLYTGPVDPGNASFTVPITTTGSAGASSAKADGLTAAAYFTEIEYNALGTKIASNEESGLWRRFGVDANGNTVATRIYGSKTDETAGRTPIVTYSAFDARNLEIARYAAKVGVDANGDGIDETSARAVSRVTYDYAGRKLTQLDPNPTALAQTFEYDGVGNLISQTDALGSVMLMFYDRRGNEVRRVDALNHTRRSVYDGAGRKVQEIDALNNATAFGYDGFDRQISQTDALGHLSQMAYDQHDRLVQTIDANGNSTGYSYDKRDNRTWTEDAKHHFFGHAYDAMGRVTDTYNFQSRTSASFVVQALIDAGNITPTPTTLAQAIDAVNNPASPYRPALVHEAIAYDIYGNKRSETDAEGRTRFSTYGAFGRLTKQTDEGGRVTSYGYDRFGRTVSETRPKDQTVTGAKNISRAYDDNGRLKSVTDSATHVSTTYTYDVAGSRKHETVTAPTFFFPIPLTARNVTYSYDGLGRMLRWSDSVTAKSLNYAYDAVGNQTGISGSDGVDHRYSFDANNHVTKILQGASSLIAAYSYDAAGERKTFNDGSSTASYSYDSGGRVVRADITPNATPANTSDDTHMTWQYDAVGNVTQYKELAADNSTVKFLQSNRYTANNRTQQTSTNDQRDPDAKNIVSTFTALDKAGRVLVEGQTNSSDPHKVRTATYTHVYSKDGRELSITATGTDDKTGNTTATFDANDRLVKLDLGKGDSQDSTEFKLFISNNDGQILRRYHDDGENDNTNPLTQFLYANGNPVGETGTKTDGSTETVLDRGNYSLLHNMGPEFPTSSVSDYVVRTGDTLQSIAAQLYGNPSLWFVIADVNGLSGSEQLKAGTRLTIPNGTQTGRLDADTHKVYKESEIVGSKLPNLKSPSSSGNICAIIGAIILAILIAIVAIIITIATAGLGTEAAVALLGVGESSVATMIVGVTIGAVVGTVVAVAASAVTQGINIAFGLQKEFDWKQFAGDIAGGVLGGIGAFASGAAEVLTKVAKLATDAARLARVAAVGVDAALQVAGEAVSQLIAHDGRIEQPWMLGVAAGAGIAGELLLAGALQSRAIRNITGAKNTAGTSADSTPTKRVQFADSPTIITNKPIGDLGKAENAAVVTTLKKVDTKFGDAGASDKATLQIKNPSESLAANDNTASLKPLTLNDNAASTLSVVQSPIPLDKGVDLREIVATKKLIAGETSGFDQKSVMEFDEGSVGKVEDKTVPIDDAPMLPEWPAQKLQRLVSENGATFQLRPNVPRNYNVTHARYTEDLYPSRTSAVGKGRIEARTQIGARTDDLLPAELRHISTLLPVEQRAQARMQKQFRTFFDVGTENPYLTESRVKDTEVVIKQRIEGLRQKAEHSGNSDLADRLATADAHELLGLIGYTAKSASGNKKAIRLGKDADLNYFYDAAKKKKLPQQIGVPDYEYINPLLRQYADIDPNAQKALDKALDAYITYAVRGLGKLEAHEGAVYRGGNFSHKLEEFKTQFKEGEIFTEKGFYSTTRDEKQAFQGDTLFVINSRGGGRKVEDISDAPHEREVLFPPESRFKVLKIEELGIDTKVLQSEGEHAIRQRVVYLDEVPVPTELTKVEKQGLGQKPSFLSQDAVLMPTRIRRAMGQGEKTLPEPSLDLRRKVGQSRIDERLDPGFKVSSDAEKALKESFQQGMAPFASSPLARRQQLLEMYGNVSKDLPNQERELARLQSQLHEALPGHVHNDLPTVQKYGLSETLSHDTKLSALKRELSKQGFEGEAELSGAVMVQLLRVKQLKQEQQLLRDTVNDPVLINSAFIHSPTHAVELKRMGLQPSAAGRVGQFTDVRLQGAMQNFGSGQMNTVYIGKYTLPGNKGSYEGVFKGEGGETITPGYGSGIKEGDIRVGYRNVATTRLDELLGFSGLTTRSEMAIHNHQLGTVSERAYGYSPKGPKVVSNQSAETYVAAYIKNNRGVTRENVVATFNAEGGPKQIGVKPVDGNDEFFFKENAFYDINYNDPALRRDLVRLQLIDSISGQVDRHPGNYFVQQDAYGKVLGVKGIDNDASWGQDLRRVERTGVKDSHLPEYLPPVVDKQAFDSIMALNHQALKHKMGGLLTSGEMSAAADRLSHVQNHLRVLESRGAVLTKLDDWTTPDVTQLLTTKKQVPDTDYFENTSYFAREVELTQLYREKGLVIPYPDKM